MALLMESCPDCPLPAGMGDILNPLPVPESLELGPDSDSYRLVPDFEFAPVGCCTAATGLAAGSDSAARRRLVAERILEADSTRESGLPPVGEQILAAEERLV